MPKPKTMAQYKKQQKMVAEQVAKLLNNQPKEALGSYIAPQVFTGWLAGIAE
jgi:DNA topoisomerase IB